MTNGNQVAKTNEPLCCLSKKNTFGLPNMNTSARCEGLQFFQWWLRCHIYDENEYISTLNFTLTDAKTNRTPGVKKMLLMRMLLGKSYVCLDPNPRKYRRPPCTSSGCRRDDCVDMHDRFDSVVGDGQWLFREFVVYAVDQCYPEFIISYERV